MNRNSVLSQEEIDALLVEHPIMSGKNVQGSFIDDLESDIRQIEKNLSPFIATKKQASENQKPIYIKIKPAVVDNNTYICDCVKNGTVMRKNTFFQEEPNTNKLLVTCPTCGVCYVLK